MKLPFDPPVAPMLARAHPALPEEGDWLFEPKWDGFRALVFWDGEEIYLQSRDRRPFNRYFPELEHGLPQVLGGAAVLDGELVVAGPRGLEFDSLQMRIHPAESRVRMLARQIPAFFVAFDLLAEGGEDLRERPQEERRRRLDAFVRPQAPLLLSPCTRDREVAADWFERFEGAGLDGVIARPPDLPYRPGERALVKVKHRREADCVVGGFRWAKDQEGRAVGSLLLGLYDSEGVLHHVGHTSSFTAKQKRELATLLEPYRGGTSFGEGRTPGGPSRWTGGKDMSWEPVRPELVCEVAFDQMQGDRIRHGATFLRWRADKTPEDCSYSQLDSAVPVELAQVFRAGHGGNG